MRRTTCWRSRGPPPVPGDVTIDLADKKVKPGRTDRIRADGPRHQGADPQPAESIRQVIKVLAPVKETERKALNGQKNARTPRTSPPEPTDEAPKIIADAGQ